MRTNPLRVVVIHQTPATLGGSERVPGESTARKCMASRKLHLTVSLQVYPSVLPTNPPVFPAIPPIQAWRIEGKRCRLTSALIQETGT